ncbi:MAG TPA: alanine--tRNA ligase [Herpetosiphonaceae bacterium]
MKSAELRQRFLDYFARHSHQVVPSSSLIPADNPTLLFTVAGMVQFNDVFLGREQRPYSRAATSQKCLRISGKQNDLENVGPSPRHHTLFEMLGNFSFGDYFKREAIEFAWEFLTKELKLDPKRLWVTVFEGDDQVPADEEAEGYWQAVGVARERILRFSAKDNFWSAGDTGPRGPCSEIHYYQGDDPDNQIAEGVNSEDDNYMEIWNLVFMQYDRDTEGNLSPLPKPSIDTGMSLERLACVVQGVTRTYETDLFTPIIHAIGENLGAPSDHYNEQWVAYHVVADHARAITFMIADGMRPGNEGRSYVLRRLLRRAAYFGQTLGFDRPFLAEIMQSVIDVMGGAYPELYDKASYIAEVITAEEERFNKTLASGLRQLESMVAALPAGATTLGGADAFKLHDTYGFPLDLTAKILEGRGLSVDEDGYTVEREAQRARGREAAQFKKGAMGERWAERELPATAFTGYHELQSWGHVLAFEVEGEEMGTVQRGNQVYLVLDRTPCYAESGGQMADTALLTGPNGSIQIDDVQKPIPGLFVHKGRVVSGTVSVGEQVEVVVDGGRRRDILRNHTATHLLHRALRDLLGGHAEQAGSLVAPERLRFDFNNQRALTHEQLRELESRVNAWIRADTEVEAAEMPMDEARKLGAMALFGEKYGDVVRVVTIGCEHGDQADPDTAGAHLHPETGVCSRELCGGTHVRRTGEIGFFRIVSEGSVAAGVRRIEALTGRGAAQWVDEQTEVLRSLADRLSAQPGQIAERLDALLGEHKQRKQEIDRLRGQLASGQVAALLEQRQERNGTPFVAARVEAPDADALRQLGEQLRDRIESGVVVLGAVIDGKPLLLAAATPDQVKAGRHAGNIVKALAPKIGGGGGGRPDFAQAGGRDADGLDQALAGVAEVF